MDAREDLAQLVTFLDRRPEDAVLATFDGVVCRLAAHHFAELLEIVLRAER